MAWRGGVPLVATGAVGSKLVFACEDVMAVSTYYERMRRWIVGGMSTVVRLLEIAAMKL
jgi:hypothetical protein